MTKENNRIHSEFEIITPCGHPLELDLLREQVSRLEQMLIAQQAMYLKFISELLNRDAFDALIPEARRHERRAMRSQYNELLRQLAARDPAFKQLMEATGAWSDLAASGAEC
jgi:hypothetical protein